MPGAGRLERLKACAEERMQTLRALLRVAVYGQVIDFGVPFRSVLVPANFTLLE